MKGNLDGALKHFGDALAINEKLGRLEGQAADLGNIGNVLKTKGDLAGALKHYQEALALDKRLGRLEGQAKQLGNMGNVLLTKGDLEGALKHYQEALELYEGMGAGRSEGADIVRWNIARVEEMRRGKG